MGATDAFLQTIADAIRPDERIGIAEWAARYRILPETSPEPGRWRNERTPYLVGIMDALSGIPSKVTRYAHDDDTVFENNFVRIVAMQKGHQLGGSALGENFVGKNITSAAGNMLAVFATIDDAEKWELDRFEPMRHSTPELRKRIPASGKKGSNNTKLRKKFPGGMLNFVGATKAGRLKSSTIRYVLLEEVDEYQLNVDGQGNPIDLVLNRTSNYGKRAKIFANSTPTVEGRSQIQKLYLRGDQRRYFVHCPDCGHPQFFKWSNLRWTAGAPETAVYHCEKPGCGVGSPEHEWKTVGYDNAYWMPTAKGDGETASFHLSALYAPLGWRSWASAARDWEVAQSDPIKMIEFINNFLAECWKDRSKEVNWKKIKARAEPYKPREIPKGCLILTAAVDTQGNRLEVGIDGWGRGMTNWTIDHIVIYGDPTTQAPWDELDKILETSFTNSFGVDMRISLCGIDSGGNATQEVYDYCRLRQHRGVFALKGAKERHKPIIGRPTSQDVTAKGKTIVNGVQLWPIGTDTAKDRIFAAILTDEEALPSDRRLHFPDGLDDEYYEQLVSEAYNPSKDRWDQLRPRNEVLDCKVYNLACAYHPRLRINMMRDHDWIELENVIEPRIGDLFSSPLPPLQTEAAPSTEEINVQTSAHADPPATQSPAVPIPSSTTDDDEETSRPRSGGWINPRRNWLSR
ncbi:phage terminase large subunit family protein [Undibacterium sp. CY21W]|uniref:phage terminase large subunit family protein n=1 Tax=Undibacterium sp. CY21W TaxID=2762293 RepID=UPI00164BA63F|nr:phage terminase large subunit family protein [Undibacterium sp. CY21W]MBC3927783.1 phage terminase large subunit family protein [Undibacterium sp. CY21W]